MTESLSKRLAAEFIGTAALLATVVGSGIMAQSLSGGNMAIALVGNTLSTGAMLFVLVSVFGPISGAHFNPAVTLVFAFRGEISWLDAGLYILIQLVAAIAGVLLAHAMFDLELLQNSVKSRSGPGMRISETVATFGLLMTILGTLKSKPGAVPAAVGLYVSAGYWFTASTCFANPAVTIARSFTNTFSGIASQDVLPFILFQLAGAILAYIVSGWLFPKQGPGLLES